MVCNTQDGKLSSPKKKRRSIEELKIKYEVTFAVETPKKLAKPKSPKKWRKSKVKQIASMFNAKISQIIKRDVNGGKYASLINEFSPESKSEPTAIFPKPVAMPRSQFIKPPKTPLPMPRKRSLVKMQPKSSSCFVPEDVFAKLSVKDKALLYTQFVEEMTKKNPKFGLMDTRNNMFINSGEVIAEKQVSVKDLMEELEFNSVFPKSNAAAAKAIQRMESMKRACEARKNFLKKSKEFEDILQKQVTTTKTKTTSLPRSQNPTNETQKSFDNEQNQTTDSIFQNIQIENLFYSWFKEKHDNDNDIENISNQSEIDEEKQKSTIDKLLEEAIAKLETVEAEQNAEVPKPMPRKQMTANLNDNSSSTSSAKPSEAEESESGVSSLHKITSEESQTENCANKTNKADNEFEFAKPLKPLRKKKLRKNPVWKKEVLQKEGNQTTSTDSESDGKHIQAQLENKMSSLHTDAQEDISEQLESQPCLELDQSLLKSVNSPRKIKSVYTLTINDLETPICTPRPSLNFAKQPRENRITSAVAKKISLTDSLTDQGFETATNDADSPLKKSAMQEKLGTANNSPVSSTLNSSKIKFSYSTRMKTQETIANDIASELKKIVELQQKAGINSPLSSSLNSSKGDFGYSTPIKTTEQHSFGATSSAKRLFSPISKPIKNRRRSFYDVESGRNSLVMQVIREDQPLEPLQTQTSNIYSETEKQFFANAPTIANSKEITEVPQEKTSQFWIKCGDFSVTLDINYISSRRLSLLYEIFSQTSCDTKDLHFGIDNNKFSVHDPLDVGNNSTRIPASKECSHYWFSTGDLAIPFSGKTLTAQKIQRLFRVIKETVEETGILRFGVDDVEFSNAPEFWYQQPKFSVESQYNMLVGLQSGDSDGLEGRSKYAWPHSKPVMISDLDQTDNEGGDNYEECGRLSFSPFGSNRYNLASLDETQLSMPRNSLAMMNLESYCGEYENEPLDQLFNNSYNQEEEQQEAWEQATAKSVPEMIYAVENEKQRLSVMQEELLNFAKPSFIAKNALDVYKGTPEYVEKLKNIVSDISNIGCSDNFKACSVDELDSYMYFLSRYAEICLSSCGKHMDTVLNALVDYKAVLV